MYPVETGEKDERKFLTEKNERNIIEYEKDDGVLEIFPRHHFLLFGLIKKDRRKRKMKKPVIGVIPLIDRERDSQWMLPGYLKGIEGAGGVPIVFPLTVDEEEIERLYQICDGVLLTGGQDINPVLYGDRKKPECGELCNERDEMEKCFYRRAMIDDKPVLGICRGIQFINVMTGGTLYQNLSTEHPSDINHKQSPPYDVPIHEVEILEDTPLRELLKIEKIPVNSYHHQAVRDLGEGLISMAVSPDGLVEAVCIPDKRFVWALQWHPEFSYRTDENSRKIFKKFVESSKE